jgi:hypothetical protein
MRKDVWRIDGSGANAVEGRVVWAPKKSIWNTFMILGSSNFCGVVANVNPATVKTMTITSAALDFMSQFSSKDSSTRASV